MGNHLSHRPSGISGRVILSDGTIENYDKPLTAAELMLEHPQQVVVEFPTAGDRKKLTPLPADTNLEKGKIYMMVPVKRGKPVSSSEEARRTANAILNSKILLSAYTGFIPLFARICPATVAGSGESATAKLMTMVPKKELEMRKTTAFLAEEERADYYLSRQLSGKNSWKPNLDTIKEKGVKAKIKHWLL